MNKLLVIRHGQTDWNAKQWAQGRTDIPLNDTGRIQAKEAQKRINIGDIDFCIASPLLRAKETAEIITNKEIPIIYDDLLVERSFGDFEGKKIDHEKLMPMWDYKTNNSNNNVESLHDCLERGKIFLEKINELYDNKTILIVTHGCFMKMIHFNIVGYDEKTDFYSFFSNNCEACEYELNNEIRKLKK